ncbi:MAG: hypothetical protein M1834_007570 [Cirrosporium novae-zelandiae]|nr:MAG: hypothetical protein M1834_007570 [Cirrosporium novae-zelandiae]
MACMSKEESITKTLAAMKATTFKSLDLILAENIANRAGSSDSHLGRESVGAESSDSRLGRESVEAQPPDSCSERESVEVESSDSSSEREIVEVESSDSSSERESAEAGFLMWPVNEPKPERPLCSWAFRGLGFPEQTARAPVPAEKTAVVFLSWTSEPHTGYYTQFIKLMEDTFHFPVYKIDIGYNRLDGPRDNTDIKDCVEEFTGEDTLLIIVHFGYAAYEPDEDWLLYGYHPGNQDYWDTCRDEWSYLRPMFDGAGSRLIIFPSDYEEVVSGSYYYEKCDGCVAPADHITARDEYLFGASNRERDDCLDPDTVFMKTLVSGLSSVATRKEFLVVHLYEIMVELSEADSTNFRSTHCGLGHRLSLKLTAPGKGPPSDCDICVGALWSWPEKHFDKYWYHEEQPSEPYQDEESEGGSETQSEWDSEGPSVEGVRRRGWKTESEWNLEEP